MGPIPPCYKVTYLSFVSCISSGTHSEEQPLKILAVFLRVVHGICRELELFIELLSQIKQDCRGFKDVKAVMRNSGNTSVRVDLSRVNTKKKCV